MNERRSDLERAAAELCKDLILEANDDELRNIVRRLVYYRANKTFAGTAAVQRTVRR